MITKKMMMFDNYDRAVDFARGPVTLDATVKYRGFTEGAVWMYYTEDGTRVEYMIIQKCVDDPQVRFRELVYLADGCGYILGRDRLVLW